MPRPARQAVASGSHLNRRSTGFSPTLSQSDTQTTSSESELPPYPSASGSSFAIPSETDSDESGGRAGHRFGRAPSGEQKGSNRNAYGRASGSGAAHTARLGSSSSGSASSDDGESSEERAARRRRLTPRRKKLTRQELDIFDDLIKLDLSPAAQWLAHSGLHLSQVLVHESRVAHTGKERKNKARPRNARPRALLAAARHPSSLLPMEREVLSILAALDGRASSITTEDHAQVLRQHGNKDTRWPSQQVESMALIDELQAVLREEQEELRRRKASLRAIGRGSSLEALPPSTATRSEQEVDESGNESVDTSSSHSSGSTRSSGNSNTSSHHTNTQRGSRSSSSRSTSFPISDDASCLRSRSLSPPPELLPRALHIQTALFRLLHQCTPSAYIRRPRLDGQGVLDRLQAAGATLEEVQKVRARLDGIVDLEMRGPSRSEPVAEHSALSHPQSHSPTPHTSQRDDVTAPNIYHPSGPYGWSHFRRGAQPLQSEPSHRAALIALRSPTCDLQGILDDPLLVPSLPTSAIPRADETSKLHRLVAPNAWRRRRTVLDKAALLASSGEAVSLAGAPIQNKSSTQDAGGGQRREVRPATVHFEKLLHRRRVMRLILNVEERQQKQQRVSPMMQTLPNDTEAEEVRGNSVVSASSGSENALRRVKQEMQGGPPDVRSEEEDGGGTKRQQDRARGKEIASVSDQATSGRVGGQKRPRPSRAAMLGADAEVAKRARHS